MPLVARRIESSVKTTVPSRRMKVVLPLLLLLLLPLRSSPLRPYVSLLARLYLCRGTLRFLPRLRNESATGHGQRGDNAVKVFHRRESARDSVVYPSVRQSVCPSARLSEGLTSAA